MDNIRLSLHKEIKLKVNYIVDKFSSLGLPTQQLSSFLARPVTFGENFIGNWDGQKVVGIGIYFQSKQDFYKVLFGQLVNGEIKGRGMLIKLFGINREKLKSSQSATSEKMMGLFLYNWQSSNKEGAYWQKDNNLNEKIYKGYFNLDNSFRKGKLEYKKSDSLVQSYNGQFKNWKFDGHGQFFVPGELKYVGGWKNHFREGFGIENDYSRNTVYRGLFEINVKHGYGEITYKIESKQSRQPKEMKLKGFWNGGAMEDTEGVFINQDGQQMGLFHRNLTRPF